MNAEIIIHTAVLNRGPVAAEGIVRDLEKGTGLVRYFHAGKVYLVTRFKSRPKHITQR